jgi:hypothetical protein
MKIAIDFDGTVVTHEYPIVGRDIGAIPILKKLLKERHELFLWTMRDGDTLLDAVNWFLGNGIQLTGINTNRNQSVWTKSPKLYAELYIDDAGLGTPLIFPMIGRPYVDWEKVEILLEAYGLLPSVNI